MRLIDYIRRGLCREPARPALIDGDHVVTWAELGRRMEALASAMAAAGLSEGDRIAVYSPNDAEAFLTILAGFRIGAVWAPMNARNSVSANEHWLRLSGCQALFYHSTLEAEAMALAPLLAQPALLVCLDRPGVGGAPSLAELEGRARGPAPEPRDAPDVVASYFPTGGTTGLSKAAQWSLATWEALVSAFYCSLPSDEPPVHLVAGPMTHAAGVLALCVLPSGGTNVILSKASPPLILDAIERRRITHLYLPPTLIYALLDHPGVRDRDFSSLKALVVAAAPIAPARLREAMEVFGPVICQSYGQAEAPMFISFLPTRELLAGPDERWSSCGRATLGMRVEIMDESGRLLGPGQRGEIVVKGSLAAPGYLGDAQATAAMTVKGWRRTGDVGYRDEAGYFFIVDRAKDMIITGGFNVFSAEVEQVLLEHPGVLDCAVVGVPDAKWGEAVKAVIELKSGVAVEPEEMQALVRARLGPVHTPKSIEIWSTLPRSPAGKVLKREIRDRFWVGHDRRI